MGGELGGNSSGGGAEKDFGGAAKPIPLPLIMSLTFLDCKLANNLIPNDF